MTHAYRAPAHPGMGYPGFVDPKPPARVRAPAAPSVFPRVDDQLVRPETREELVRGRLVMAPPALEPHADCQADVVSLARRASAKGYIGSAELLTRAGPKSDFATDACIRREGIDPATGGRYLEELSFEVVSEQSLRDITERAEDLSTRGVRRIIAIFVKKNEVREWSPERNEWIVLDPSSVLEDRTLAAPIPIRALLDAAAADEAVVRALRAKQVPAIMALEEEGRREGIVEGIVALCEALDIPLDAQRRATLQGLDVAGLRALLHTLGTERRWA